MKKQVKCAICDHFGPAEGVHLHEVRMHGKPQRGPELGKVGGPWQPARKGVGQPGQTVPTEDWKALWREIDRLRG